MGKLTTLICMAVIMAALCARTQKMNPHLFNQASGYHVTGNR